MSHEATQALCCILLDEWWTSQVVTRDVPSRPCITRMQCWALPIYTGPPVLPCIPSPIMGGMREQGTISQGANSQLWQLNTKSGSQTNGVTLW